MSCGRKRLEKVAAAGRWIIWVAGQVFSGCRGGVQGAKKNPESWPAPLKDSLVGTIQWRVVSREKGGCLARN